MLSYHVHSGPSSTGSSGFSEKRASGAATAGTAPYLLLAHGALSNSAQWTLNIDALKGFCTPVTVELLGHGDSPSPVDLAHYEPAAYIDYFEAIRKTLGVDRWFLCGYSLSAGLTVRYAMTYPQHVYGHMFTNSRSAFATQKLMQEWSETGEATIERADKQGLSFLEKNPLHPRFATALPKAVYTPLVERSARLNPTGASRTLAITAPNASVRDQIESNSRPALLLQGVREKGFATDANFARDAMPNLTVHELDAGHGVNMQAAESFNKHVEDFVAAWAT